jgi:hypothetical protein
VYRTKVDTRDELFDPIMEVIARIKDVKMHSDEQHAVSSKESLSALMSKAEFSKICCTR